MIPIAHRRGALQSHCSTGMNFLRGRGPQWLLAELLFVVSLLVGVYGFPKARTTLHSTGISSPYYTRQLFPKFRNMITPCRSSAHQSSDNKITDNKVARLKARLASSGRSGLLAYGALNCMYYTIATAVAWNVSLRNFKLVSSLSLLERIRLVLSRLGSVSVVVWAGSQVTKLFRLSGAIFLAPTCDKLQQQVQDKFKLRDRNAAFWFLIRGIWITFAAFYISFVLVGTSVSYVAVSQ